MLRQPSHPHQLRRPNQLVYFRISISRTLVLVFFAFLVITLSKFSGYRRCYDLSYWMQPKFLIKFNFWWSSQNHNQQYIVYSKVRSHNWSILIEIPKPRRRSPEPAMQRINFLFNSHQICWLANLSLIFKSFFFVRIFLFPYPLFVCNVHSRSAYPVSWKLSSKY